MSQYNNLDRMREIVAALTTHNGQHASIHLGTAVITGTLDTSQLNSEIIKVTDAGAVVWTISAYNVLAVGIG